MEKKKITKKKTTTKKENLFPIYFKGKEYFESDCDDVFLAFYHSRSALNGLGGVYASDGTRIYPDGSMNDF